MPNKFIKIPGRPATLDQGKPVDVVYLDFQKAFDKVPHKKLLFKLREMGITGQIYDWISDWLNDREQRVVLLGRCSEWVRVRSGVPQGSILGPLLFLVYINDLEDNIVGLMLKFADDTKLYGSVATPADERQLQLDLDTLGQWSDCWWMPFNVGKCKIMHFGHNNRNADYFLQGIKLQVVTEERDLGIIMQSNLKCDKQCAKAVKTATRVLGMIKRTFVHLDKVVFLALYKSLVRPHLEYCVQAWCPHYCKDIDLLERVQRRATKMVTVLGKCSYEDRLKILGITTLETRRVRGDLIEVFKILKGVVNVESKIFFNVVESGTRGHSLKLFKPGCRLDVRKYFFSHRVIEVWNSLPEEVVSSATVDRFKSKLDTHMEGRGFI